MDDSLKLYRYLIFRNRLRGAWNKLGFYARGSFYTVQLLLFTYQNLRVLHHFHWQGRKKQRSGPHQCQLRHLVATLRQCFRLFSPRYLFASARKVSPTRDQQLQYESLYRELDTLQWAHFHFDQTTATSSFQQMLVGSPDVASLTASLSLKDSPNSLSQYKRDVRKAGVRGWWWKRLSLALAWKWQEFRRKQILRAQLRSLEQQVQMVMLREQQRMASSTQTALVLTLANSIDLRTTKELAVLCQPGGKKRRKRKLTKEELADFDHALSQLDHNFATLRRTIGQGRYTDGR
ncbi:MAG: hypothetical protein AB7G75_30465 [Candidatus Binatia bacterium]